MLHFVRDIRNRGDERESRALRPLIEDLDQYGLLFVVTCVNELCVKRLVRKWMLCIRTLALLRILSIQVLYSKFPC
jgi:hypothetical protein